jgi:integrase/recombinase XerD
MIRTVSLWIRSHGKFSKPIYQDKRQTRLKPQDGEYYLRCAGKWEAVGSDPLLALDAQAHKEKMLRDMERGVVPVSEALPHLKSPREETRLTVTAAIREYMTTGKAAEKDWRKHTRQCYALALKLFTESCEKTYIDEIDGDDLRAFKVFLRKQRTSVCKNIHPRTVWNHFNNTIAFLNTYGRINLILQNEWPTYEEKKVVAYDPEVMACLLQFASVDESDVLEFFMGVGFRNGESTHIEWPDIDLRNKEVHIYSKRERFDWQIKDSEQRVIGISDSLAERLRVRHQRHPGNGLVFPNSDGNPDRHLLRIIKRVAWRAGLNCGQCEGTHNRKRKSCVEAPVCRKWIIHTLRKTWATFQARIGTDFPTIQADLGHSSPATTQKYLASEERRSLRRRQQINAAAALVHTTTESGVKPSTQ